MPTVTVIVVNYNGRDHLAGCLSALCAAEAPWPVEILVVDNASSDDSLALAERWTTVDARVRVMRSPRNRGYAGAVNFALPQAGGRYLAIINADVLVTPGWLVESVGFMESHPQAGAVSPLLLLASAPDQTNAMGQAVHVTGLGFNRSLGQPAGRAGDRPVPVSGIHGGAFIIRRAIIEKMGGLDDSGFLYHEDVEISWLLNIMGYDLYCIPQARVLHKYSLTMYPEKLFLLERNRVAMLLSYLAPAWLALLLPFLACTEAMMWAYCFLRGRRFLRAKAASYAWVARQGRQIKRRRTLVRAVRRRTDAQVLRRLAWGYAWGQFLTLGRERGESQRRHTAPPPVSLGEPS